jgi:aminobenzoyl-glutamate utilization protein B
MQNSDAIWDAIDGKRVRFTELSDAVWGTPEICYTEVRSAEAHRAALEAEGFRVTSGLAGIPTAVMGEAGSGGPLIAILGEYDALPGLSQEAGVTERREVVAGGHGHGCGHNMLGAASLLAATALKDHLAKNGLAGRVRYYGCPAEEGGAAKTFLVRAGLFDGVDAAVSWHPAGFTEVNRTPSLANTRLDFRFTGRAAHAAAAPHLGRSALDAVELMNVGVNYMREHMTSDARVHYAIIDAGGVAPNVVQAKAAVRYSIRALELADMLVLVERVKNIARGAALMTETAVAFEFVSAVSNLLANPPLEEALHAEALRLGPVPFDDADRAFAARIRESFAEGDIANAYRRVGKPLRTDEPLCSEILSFEHGGIPMLGSTDVGDVSWAVPTVQLNGASYAIGTPDHSWQLVAQGKAPAAHKALVYAAKVMAATALRIATDEDLRRRARADHAARLAASPYVSPIPDGVAPPIGRMG